MLIYAQTSVACKDRYSKINKLGQQGKDSNIGQHQTNDHRPQQHD